MPGYELERFVHLNETEKTEMTCSICHDILHNPKVTNCCLQTFCEECISEWLTTNNTCPYDREDLTFDQLTRPPRMLMNMLGKLQIYCTYRANGCQEIVLLENLNNHMNCCRFDKSICNECGFEILEDHNCLKCLIDRNKALELRVKSLETENDNQLQTIEYLTDENPSLISLNSKISENLMLIDARKNLNSMTLNSVGTPSETTYKIVKEVKDALIRGKDLSKICITIRNNVESKFGGLWQCNTLYDGVGNYSCIVENKYFVSLTFGKLRIDVHKVHESIDLKKFAQRLRSLELSEELVIEQTNMTLVNTNFVKTVIFTDIKKWNNWEEFTTDISKEMLQKFGGVWHCIVYKRYSGCCCVWPEVETYINFYISDMSFIIFQVKYKNEGYRRFFSF